MQAPGPPAPGSPERRSAISAAISAAALDAASKHALSHQRPGHCQEQVLLPTRRAGHRAGHGRVGLAGPHGPEPSSPEGALSPPSSPSHLSTAPAQPDPGMGLTDAQPAPPSQHLPPPPTSRQQQHSMLSPSRLARSTFATPELPSFTAQGAAMGRPQGAGSQINARPSSELTTPATTSVATVITAHTTTAPAATPDSRRGRHSRSPVHGVRRSLGSPEPGRHRSWTPLSWDSSPPSTSGSVRSSLHSVQDSLRGGIGTPLLGVTIVGTAVAAAAASVAVAPASIAAVADSPSAESVETPAANQSEAMAPAVAPSAAAAEEQAHGEAEGLQASGAEGDADADGWGGFGTGPLLKCQESATLGGETNATAASAADAMPEPGAAGGSDTATGDEGAGGSGNGRGGDGGGDIGAGSSGGDDRGSVGNELQAVASSDPATEPQGDPFCASPASAVAAVAAAAATCADANSSTVGGDGIVSGAPEVSLKPQALAEAAELSFQPYLEPEAVAATAAAMTGGAGAPAAILPPPAAEADHAVPPLASTGAGMASASVTTSHAAAGRLVAGTAAAMPATAVAGAATAVRFSGWSDRPPLLWPSSGSLGLNQIRNHYLSLQAQAHVSQQPQGGSLRQIQRTQEGERCEPPSPPTWLGHQEPQQGQPQQQLPQGARSLLSGSPASVATGVEEEARLLQRRQQQAQPQQQRPQPQEQEPSGASPSGAHGGDPIASAANTAAKVARRAHSSYDRKPPHHRVSDAGTGGISATPMRSAKSSRDGDAAAAGRSRRGDGSGGGGRSGRWPMFRSQSAREVHGRASMLHRTAAVPGLGAEVSAPALFGGPDSESDPELGLHVDPAAAASASGVDQSYAMTLDAAFWGGHPTILGDDSAAQPLRTTKSFIAPVAARVEGELPKRATRLAHPNPNLFVDVSSGDGACGDAAAAAAGGAAAAACSPSTCASPAGAAAPSNSGGGAFAGAGGAAAAGRVMASLPSIGRALWQSPMGAVIPLPSTAADDPVLVHVMQTARKRAAEEKLKRRAAAAAAAAAAAVEAAEAAAAARGSGDESGADDAGGVDEGEATARVALDKTRAEELLRMKQAEAWAQAHRQIPRTKRMSPAVGKIVEHWFTLIDGDNNGQLEPREVADALRAAGVPCSEVDIAELIRTIDANRDGHVSWREFQAFLLKEIGTGKSLTNMEYLLPSGRRLPFAAMITRLKRLRVLDDVMKGGRSRNRYVDLLYNRDALAAEMGLSQEAAAALQASAFEWDGEQGANGSGWWTRRSTGARRRRLQQLFQLERQGAAEAEAARQAAWEAERAAAAARQAARERQRRRAAAEPAVAAARESSPSRLSVGRYGGGRRVEFGADGGDGGSASGGREGSGDDGAGSGGEGCEQLDAAAVAGFGEGIAGATFFPRHSPEVSVLQGACSMSSAPAALDAGPDTTGEQSSDAKEQDGDHRTEVFKLTEVELPTVPEEPAPSPTVELPPAEPLPADAAASPPSGPAGAVSRAEVGPPEVRPQALPDSSSPSPSLSRLALPIIPAVPPVKRPDTRAFQRALQGVRRSAPAYLMQRLRIPDPREAMAAAAAAAGPMSPPPGSTASPRRRRSRGGGGGGASRTTAWANTRASAPGDAIAGGGSSLAGEESYMSYLSAASGGDSLGGAGTGLTSDPAAWMLEAAATEAEAATGTAAAEMYTTTRSADAAVTAAAASSAVAAAAAGAYCTMYGAGFNRYRRWNMFAIDPATEHPDYWQAKAAALLMRHTRRAVLGVAGAGGAVATAAAAATAAASAVAAADQDIELGSGAVLPPPTAAVLATLPPPKARPPPRSPSQQAAQHVHGLHVHPHRRHLSQQELQLELRQQPQPSMQPASHIGGGGSGCLLPNLPNLPSPPPNDAGAGAAGVFAAWGSPVRLAPSNADGSGAGMRRVQRQTAPIPEPLSLMSVGSISPANSPQHREGGLPQTQLEPVATRGSALPAVVAAAPVSRQRAVPHSRQ